MRSPIDIILLTHNRLDYLVATVDALEQRTDVPFRLTVVDNASGPDVRNWLAASRRRFANVILRPSNEHVPAFQYGISATTSDPYVVTDPDLVVPELEPSWLEQMLELLDRYPDFGLIGAGLNPVNRPSMLPPERILPDRSIGGEIVEEPVGTWFQMIRRAAFRGPYHSDSDTCRAVQRAGFRVGWTTRIRALHLGWDDAKLHPEHLAAKHAVGEYYPPYAEVETLERPPSLLELARAAPVLAEIRSAGVPETSIVECAWSHPVLGAAVPEVTAIAGPARRLPFPDQSVGAVVLFDPPKDSAAELVTDACRVATRIAVVSADLETLAARLADELAPAGWRGREATAVGDAMLGLMRTADRNAADSLSKYRTLGDREDWLDLFRHARFGAATKRLFIFESEGPGAVASLRLPAGTSALHPLPRDPGLNMPLGWRVRHGLVRAAAALRRR